MIVNEYAVTKELYMAWNNQNRKKGVQRKITIMWIVIIVLIIAANVVFFMSPENDPKLWIAFECMMMIYSIYHLFFRRRMAAARMYDKLAEQLGRDWTRSVVFDEKEILISDGGKYDVKYPYSEIESVKGIGNEITLVTDKQMTIRIYKDSFTEGDYSRFKRFIESKVFNRCSLM